MMNNNHYQDKCYNLPCVIYHKLLKLYEAQSFISLEETGKVSGASHRNDTETKQNKSGKNLSMTHTSPVDSNLKATFGFIGNSSFTEVPIYPNFS